MNTAQFVNNTLQLPIQSIQNTLNLLDDDATVPFIARYRKELTGGLDEIQIFEIQKRKKLFEELEKRKVTILKSLEEQGVLTEVLQTKIKETYDSITLEDIYLPYKKKRKTKAETARNNGLEPLAKIIMAQRTNNLKDTAQRFLSKEVTTIEKALEGARHIIAEWVSENIWVRQYLRRVYNQSAHIKTKVKKKKEIEEKAQKYLNYFDWEESLKRCPSHRLLAMLRAEKEEVINIKLEVDTEAVLEKLNSRFIRNNNITAQQIEMSILDAYKRLLAPSIGTETLNRYKELADITAIAVFSKNLRQLLLAPPLGEKTVLAVDPGFRTGCKIAILNKQGEFVTSHTIFPHASIDKQQEATVIIQKLIEKYQIEAIAIGNGTASRETEQFIKNIKPAIDIPIFIVNEAGASIYSASAIARKEFPNQDITVRGTISIGRRLQDPLAELVKIDAKSIGVGQYQHDVNQNLLKEELDNVVQSAVNLVGVNLNTAGIHLLKYVSGIGEKLAESIVAYRAENGSFKSRNELKDVPRLGNKAFEQCAGFLRIKNGENPLDDSAVHPESYGIVHKMAKSLQVEISNLIGNKELLQKVDLEQFITEKTGLPTLKDIVKELEKQGLDIREKARVFEFSNELKTIEDIKIGSVYPGIVSNITNFGCFVNLGIKENGLIHISKMSDSFVSNPNDLVKLNQQVRVLVESVDMDRKRIGLKLLTN